MKYRSLLSIVIFSDSKKVPVVEWTIKQEINLSLSIRRCEHFIREKVSVSHCFLIIIKEYLSMMLKALSLFDILYVKKPRWIFELKLLELSE